MNTAEIEMRKDYPSLEATPSGGTEVCNWHTVDERGNRTRLGDHSDSDEIPLNLNISDGSSVSWDILGQALHKFIADHIKRGSKIEITETDQKGVVLMKAIPTREG